VVICAILLVKYIGELKELKAIKYELKMDAIYTIL
jgi:hypothetical protein